MIERLEDLPAGTVGFRCSGQLSGEAMEQVVAPAISAAIAEYDRIKALLRFEPDFEGFSFAAAWDDAGLGLRYWDGFERLAVVTDLAWMGHGLRALGVLLPCPLRIFPLAEEATARRWLSEALGTIHLDQQGEVITITLIGQLDPESYARVDDDLAQLFSAVAEPRVLLDLRQFEGWLGLGALRQHLALIRDYRRQPRRLALVCGSAWQPLARRLLPAFSRAECRCFASTDLLTAQEWICAD
jgi:SpoIIAA-like